MVDLKTLKAKAIEIGGEEWGILADSANDADFQSILSQQERNMLNQFYENPNSLNGFRDYFSDIISKFISWNVYKKSNLKDLAGKVSLLVNEVEGSREELQTIRDTAKYIGGAEVLVEYSKAFATTAITHKENARSQLIFYMISLLCFTFILGLTFFVSIAEFSFFKNLIASDLKELPLNTGFFALKALLIFFVYQVTQFFRKNYGAEKHLQEVYQHRSDTLQSLHAVYNVLDNAVEKDKILSAGVLFAYERGETGYITTREGAGAGDGIVEGLFGRIFNK